MVSQELVVYEEDRIIHNHTEFEKHILDCYPQEACGVLYQNKFTVVENIHPNPLNNFLFPEHVTESLLGKEDYRILHSHTFLQGNYDLRIPSKDDMINQQNGNVEWGIVHCDGENVSEPLWFGFPSKEELLMRPYVPKIFDCFTLARDYYQQERGLTFPDIPRDVDWESENPNLMKDKCKEFGFTEISIGKEIKVHDLLLFNINSSYANHVGIYVDKGFDMEYPEKDFIHHLLERKSCLDNLERWKRNLIGVLRYEK